MIVDSAYIRSFLIILLALITLLGMFIVGKTLSQVQSRLAIALALGFVIFVAAFFNTQVALHVLIFSMLLSPEIVIAETSAREVTIRIDDLILAIISFTWLAKMTINKELTALRDTPLNAPIFAYIAICAFSTALGVVLGKVSPLSGFFFVLKYSEYFLVYLMVVNLLSNEQQARGFIIAMLVTCTIVSLYGISQIPSGRRVSTPFEGESGEPGTFGGYLVLMMALALAFLVYAESQKQRVLFAGLAVIMLLPLLFTLSRASFMAFFPMFFTLLFFSRRKKTLAILLAFAILVGPFLMPQYVINRIRYTFEEQAGSTRIGSIALEGSASARIESWKKVLTKKWPARPLFGHGVTGAGFIDGQYPRVLAETGALGLFLFLWLLWKIFSNALLVYRAAEDDFSQILSLSLMAGLVGLMFHAMTANTFIIVRIMEPFWFLTGIVMMLPAMEMEKEVREGKVQ